MLKNAHEGADLRGAAREHGRSSQHLYPDGARRPDVAGHGGLNSFDGEEEFKEVPRADDVEVSQER